MKTVLISGTSGGIGGAVKSAALRRGWRVVEVNRDDYANNRLFDADALRGAIDAVVFATGTCPVKPVALASDAIFEETMRVNCGAFLRLMRELLEARANSPAGMKAVAISSVSAVEGWAGGAVYCASKGALSAICRAMDVELKPKGISVAAIEPRYVKTKMFDNCAGRMGVPASAAQSPDELAEEICAAL